MKLQKIGDIQPTLPLTEYDFLKKYRESFAVSELGRIHAMLPIKAMAQELASHFRKKHPQGNKPMFPAEGEIALMFLKPYTGLSDDGLIEMHNDSIHMQMFCGVLIDNRSFCTANGITTGFVRKGPKPKDEPAEVSTARRIIGNLRATVMEGSFGNQKLHFRLGRIAARNRHSETLLLFFGIHMVNAATLAARQLADGLREKEKKRS